MATNDIKILRETASGEFTESLLGLKYPAVEATFDLPTTSLKLKGAAPLPLNTVVGVDGLGKAAALSTTSSTVLQIDTNVATNYVLTGKEIKFYVLSDTRVVVISRAKTGNDRRILTFELFNTTVMSNWTLLGSVDFTMTLGMSTWNGSGTFFQTDEPMVFTSGVTNLVPIFEEHWVDGGNPNIVHIPILIPDWRRFGLTPDGALYKFYQNSFSILEVDVNVVANTIGTTNKQFTTGLPLWYTQNRMDASHDILVDETGALITTTAGANTGQETRINPNVHFRRNPTSGNYLVLVQHGGWSRGYNVPVGGFSIPWFSGGFMESYYLDPAGATITHDIIRSYSMHTLSPTNTSVENRDVMEWTSVPYTTGFLILYRRKFKYQYATTGFPIFFPVPPTSGEAVYFNMNRLSDPADTTNYEGFVLGTAGNYPTPSRGIFTFTFPNYPIELNLVQQNAALNYAVFLFRNNFGDLYQMSHYLGLLNDAGIGGSWSALVQNATNAVPAQVIHRNSASTIFRNPTTNAAFLGQMGTSPIWNVAELAFGSNVNALAQAPQLGQYLPALTIDQASTPYLARQLVGEFIPNATQLRFKKFSYTSVSYSLQPIGVLLDPIINIDDIVDVGIKGPVPFSGFTTGQHVGFNTTTGQFVVLAGLGLHSIPLNVFYFGTMLSNTTIKLNPNPLSTAPG